MNPLPSVPEHEFSKNLEAKETIEKNSNLFKIVTPINVDRFEQLLHAHPNHPFVESVCQGLREGFWPWANTHYETYPSIVDALLRMLQNPVERDFLQAQQDKERSKGRFSGSFGLNLFPGIHASPIHAVPKPGTDKLHLVINQSMGLFAPNTMIN